MSMYYNIKRNKMDFILTDMMPLEISELFSLRQFYDFLLQDKVAKSKLKELINKLLEVKTNNSDLYDSNWNSVPWEFNIYKRNGNMRKMSIPNPLGIIMSYTFISLYEKEILMELTNNNIFSLRYHVNNNKLYYKDVSKSIVEYFFKTMKLIKKQAIEQSGTYFSIEKYRSINEFTNSKKWSLLCTKFSKFLKMDYKDCFRSIYSHVYNWFQYPNIQDSKNSKQNSSLYTTIDNIIQKLNASATNGIIVGPEFSRMLAEIFLQNIDVLVYQELLKTNYKLNKDYYIGRYVDDIFIFSNSDEVLSLIKNIYIQQGSKYYITFNENKIQNEVMPFCWSPWFNDTYSLSFDIGNLFYVDGEDKEFYYKEKSLFSNSFKQKFNNIICQSKIEERDTIVSYILSTILNKIKPQKKNKIFKEDISKSRLLNFMDYVFYVYSHSITFNNTQKLISIITLISKDINDNNKLKTLLNKMFLDYDIIFKHNIYDIINLLTLCCDYKIELKSSIENNIIDQVYKADDPIVYATWMLYCQYDKDLLNEQVNKILVIIKNKLEYLDNKLDEFFMYKECWYVFIFKNCPYCDYDTKILIEKIIKDLDSKKFNGNSKNAKEIIISFLKENNKGFFLWNFSGKNVAEQITYRTFQKTIFRRSSNHYKIFDYASF